MSQPATEAECDMTPMIDVIFLLIIFFLCIDFKTLEAKLPAYLPKNKGVHAGDDYEQLTVKIDCDVWGREESRDPGRPDAPHRLVGHRIHWRINARRFDEPEDFRRELERIASDPSRRVADPNHPSRTRMIPVVIEPRVGVVFCDVTSTLDLVCAAGFDDVTFGGSAGKR